MTRVSALSAVAALFLVGVLVGALGMHLYHVGATPGGSPPPEPGHGRGPWALVSGRFLERLNHELDLTPEQRDEIERLVLQSRRELEELRSELRPRVEESMRQTRDRIREVLTAEQARIFDEMAPLPRPRRPRPGRGRRFAP